MVLCLAFFKAASAAPAQKALLNGELSLTLNEAIELALDRNPLLLVEKIHLEQARHKIDEEKGNFDWLFNAKGTVARRENIIASRFFPTGLYVDKESAPSVGIEGKTTTGGRFSVELDYRRLLSTSNTQTLSPQYSANLVVNFSHSFLRDFGAVNKTGILVAQKGKEIAERNLNQKVVQLVQQVEEAYWNLVYLRDDLQEKHRSLEVAQGLLKRNGDLQRAGLLAVVSVLEARSAVAEREEDVINAEAEVAKAEDRFKVLLWVEPSAASVTPVDRPEAGTNDFDAAKSLQIALQRRPELEALQKDVERREIELKYAANQTRPRLDLNTQYGVAGLSGSANPTCIDPTSAFCQPVGASVSGSLFAGQTQPQDALTQLFSRHPFDNWSVEVKLQVPLSNRTSNAQYSEASLKLLESTTRFRAFRAQIEQEIRDAIRETQTARKRIAASHESITFVEDQLAGARRKFDAGLASSYDVLQLLGELDKAKSSERKALMDFKIGESKIRYAEATTLAKYNIELKQPRYWPPQSDAN
jgi:HAE1 family hydrophobic/amphiphilic exporter-1